MTITTYTPERRVTKPLLARLFAMGLAAASLIGFSGSSDAGILDYLPCYNSDPRPHQAPQDGVYFGFHPTAWRKWNGGSVVSYPWHPHDVNTESTQPSYPAVNENVAPVAPPLPTLSPAPSLISPPPSPQPAPELRKPTSSQQESAGHWQSLSHRRHYRNEVQYRGAAAPHLRQVSAPAVFHRAPVKLLSPTFR
jgi:hypothetical protein